MTNRPNQYDPADDGRIPVARYPVPFNGRVRTGPLSAEQRAVVAGLSAKYPSLFGGSAPRKVG